MAASARLTIRRWGNSLAVRIPARLARSAHLADGQEVEVVVRVNGVTVETIGPRKPTLAEQLERFDPVLHGGEAMAFEPIGKEIF